MHSLSRELRTREWFRSSVSLVGHPRRKNLREDGRGLTKEGSTKSPLGIEFSTKGNSNSHGGDLVKVALEEGE
jgi:hypothetical protein